MTVTVKVLIPAKTAEATQTTQYTASNVTTIIDKFTATNYTPTSTPEQLAGGVCVCSPFHQAHLPPPTQRFSLSAQALSS